MSKTYSSSNISTISNPQQFQIVVASTFSRIQQITWKGIIILIHSFLLSNLKTFEIGLQEIRHILMRSTKISSQERLNILLDAISNNLELDRKQYSLLNSQDKQMDDQIQLNSQQKQNSLRVLAISADVFQEEMLTAWDSICEVISQKLGDDDVNTYLTLSETVGTVVRKTFTHVKNDREVEEELDNQFRCWEQLIELFLIEMEDHQRQSLNQKKKSIVSAMCLSMAIQSVPQIYVISCRMKITMCILRSLQNRKCAAENQLIDCLLSLIIACEEHFQDCFQYVLPFLLEYLSQKIVESQKEKDQTQQYLQDYSQKMKIIIDTIYTLSVIIPNEISQYKQEIIQLISPFKKHNNKQLKTAATVTLLSLQQITVSPQALIQEQNNLSFQQQQQPVNFFTRITCPMFSTITKYKHKFQLCEI